MSQEAGDRVFGHGDHVTRKNSTGSQLDQGKWVEPTGDEKINYTDTDNSRDSLVGVLSDDVADGEYGRVHTRGIVIARVDEDVSAGDELAPPDSSANDDEAGEADTGGSSGIFALEDAYDPGNGNHVAKCLLR